MCNQDQKETMMLANKTGGIIFWRVLPFRRGAACRVIAALLLALCLSIAPEAVAAELVLEPEKLDAFFTGVRAMRIAIDSKAGKLAAAPLPPCSVFSYGAGGPIHVNLTIIGNQEKVDRASLARVVMAAAYGLSAMSGEPERRAIARLHAVFSPGEFSLPLAEAEFAADKAGGTAAFPGPGWISVRVAERGLSDREILYLRNLQSFPDEGGGKRDFFKNPAKGLPPMLDEMISRQMGIAPGSVSLRHMALKPFAQ